MYIVRVVLCQITFGDQSGAAAVSVLVYLTDIDRSRRYIPVDPGAFHKCGLFILASTKYIAAGVESS